jgi:hypothetical protein
MDSLTSNVLYLILSLLPVWQTIQMRRVSKKMGRLVMFNTERYKNCCAEYARLYLCYYTGNPLRQCCNDEYLDGVLYYAKKLGGACLGLIVPTKYYKGFAAAIEKFHFDQFWWGSLFYRACKNGDLPIIIACIERGHQSKEQAIQLLLSHKHEDALQAILA